MSTVYQCSFAKKEAPDRACGIDGESFDYSREECHHPLTLEQAKLFAAAPELLEALRDIQWDADGVPTVWPNRERVDALLSAVEGK